jgi:ABC-type nitrate/sulfonate/bicarbonate transport system permease component
MAVFWQSCSVIVGANRCPGIFQTLTTLVQSLFQEPIIEAQGGGSDGFCPHLLATIAGFSGGFTGGIIIGYLVALAMAQFKPLSLLIEPALEFFRALPPLLVIPFAILLCKSNDSLQAFTVGIYSAFSICVYTLNAIANIPPNYLDLAKLLGAPRLRSVLDVQVPAIMPELLGALRVTAALSLGISVVVEYMAAPQGLGRVMKFAISYSRIDLIMVSAIWVVLIALLVDAAISLIFKLSLHWTKRQRHTQR